MGLLVSCCLRLFGYSNLENGSTSKRKQEINTMLIDRENDGRRYCNPPPDAAQRSGGSGNDALYGDGTGSDYSSLGRGQDPYASGSTANCYSPRGWSSPSEMLSSPQFNSPGQGGAGSSMPKGYREDGSKDRIKLKLNLVDSLKRSGTSGYK